MADEIVVGDAIFLKVARPDLTTDLPVSYEVVARVTAVGDTWIQVALSEDAPLAEGVIEAGQYLTLERGGRLATWRRDDG